MENKGLTNINDAAYQKLIDNITTLWGEAKSKAIAAVNTELLDANWQTGKYIVEFEQGGKQRAEYGKRLLVNLAKDLTARNGKGFNRTNGSHEKPCGLCVDFCQSEQEELSIYDATQQSPELFHFCIKGFSRCICRPIDKVVKDFILSVIHSCRYIIEGFIPKFSYFAIP